VTHLGRDALVRMRDGELAPADLLAADAHVASCESCRTRLAAVVAAGSPHLSPEDLAALVDGMGSFEARAHMARCPQCTADFQALAGFAGDVVTATVKPWRLASRLVAGLAAAVVVAAGIWWLGSGGGAAVMTAIDAAPRPGEIVWDWGRRIALDSTGQLSGGEGLSARDSAWIVDAMHGAAPRDLTPSAAGAAAQDMRRASPDAHLLIGALQEEAGDWQAAAAEYRALLDENPGSPLVKRALERIGAKR
jgi:Putative zinc-finger